LKKKIKVNIVKPITLNKNLAHIWTHTILPFKKGKLLFCPANIAPIFIPKNKKLVVTIHDVAFLVYQDSFSKFFQWYYRFIIPKNIKRADKIITVSKYSKKEIEKFYPNAKGKIEVIYLGIDEKFKPLKNIKKKNQILYVGSLNERKNFYGVIEAFLSLNDKNLKLIMVGNFSKTFALNKASIDILKKAKQNENIIFKSNVSDNELIKLYNESRLFVYPSFYEGFGLPPLEAMACGTPVITSNVSSLPEVGGDAVVYCNPYDVEDIKEKIEMVLNDEKLQQEMIQKGLQRAKEFTWEKSAKEHLEVFEEVLRN
jgi:glycosyltransferase involved in cell wall biosynthesis